MSTVQFSPAQGGIRRLDWLRFGASKMKIWKQDPSVDELGIRTSYIHTNVQDGPRDDTILIKEMPATKADPNGDFMFDPQKNPAEFDAVHTFTIIRQVITMYERALNRMGFPTKFQWQWGKDPINVFPHGGEDANAYYSREEQALRFFHFNPSQLPKKKKGLGFFHFNAKKTQPEIYTCRSFDIVSHEAGHALLDAWKPGWYSSWHPHTGGLHESVGDLTAIFTMLGQLDVCEAIVAESKADLHNKTFFSALAEEFGDALGRPMGLRNADNDLKLSDVSTQAHQISQVFTGAVYNILADIFQDNLALDREDPAMTLFKVGEHLNTMLIGAIQKSPDENATFKDVAENMMALENNPRWRDMMNNRFKEREILQEPDKRILIQPQPVSFQNCCPTMQRAEHINLVNNAVAQAKRLNLTG